MHYPQLKPYILAEFKKLPKSEQTELLEGKKPDEDLASYLETVMWYDIQDNVDNLPVEIITHSHI